MSDNKTLLQGPAQVVTIKDSTNRRRTLSLSGQSVPVVVAASVSASAVAPKTTWDSVVKSYLKSRISWLLVVSTIFLAICTVSFQQYVSDNKNCRMSYMNPTYTELSAFDGNYTQHASKYSLYWYREKLIDTWDRPRGTPVLFIPGNAGSFRQVRAIASETSMQRNATGHDGLDFYTADFREELTAFDGKSLEEQAEYLNDAIEFILALYGDDVRDKKKRPVILVGHSMGGVVARTMLTLPNYRENTVETILTLAAPHAAPPASVDGDLVRVYDRVNEFWRRGGDRIKEVALVSVAAGGLDRTIPSELTSVESIINKTNGFTVYTSSIPFVWTAIDHEAIVWCDQFRTTLVKALNESVSRSLADRIEIFRRHFLVEYDIPVDDEVQLKIHRSKVVTSREVYLATGSGKTKPMHLVPLSNATHVSILTDQPLVGSQHEEGVYVLGCTNAGHCKNLGGRAILIPKAASNAALDFPNDKETLHFLNFDIDSDFGYDHVAIVETVGCKPGVVVAEAHDSSSKIVVSDNLVRLSFGKTIRPAKKMMVELELESVWSSLIALDMTVSTKGSSASFQPFVRQYIHEPYESKFFLNVGDETLKINSHGIAPFVPRGDSQLPHLAFQVWSHEEIEVHIRVNWVDTAARLVLHYRQAIFTLPFAIMMMVLLIQLHSYHVTGSYPSFSSATSTFIHTWLFNILILTSVLPLYSSQISHLLQLIDPTFQASHIFLGLHEAHLWALGPILVLVATALTYLHGQLVAITIATADYLLPKAIVACTRLLNDSLFIMLYFPLFYVPYDLVHFGIVVMQLLNTVRSKQTSSASLFNFCGTIFAFLLWMLPIAAIKTVVWTTTFRFFEQVSFYNVLSIAPILMYVMGLSRSTARLPNLTGWRYAVTMGLVVYGAAYAAMFGVMRCYRLHQCFNAVCGWLLLMDLVDNWATRNNTNKPEKNSDD